MKIFKKFRDAGKYLTQFIQASLNGKPMHMQYGRLLSAVVCWLFAMEIYLEGQFAWKHSVSFQQQWGWEHAPTAKQINRQQGEQWEEQFQEAPEAAAGAAGAAAPPVAAVIISTTAK